MKNIFNKFYNPRTVSVNFKLKQDINPKKLYKTISILNQEEDEDDR